MQIADEAYKNDPTFCQFHCQIFHSSIVAVLDSLKPHMTEPVVTLSGKTNNAIDAMDWKCSKSVV